MRRVLLSGMMVGATAFALPVLAQQPRDTLPFRIDRAQVTTGSRDEDWLLMLQAAGRVPLLPTSIRSFSASALDSLLGPPRRGSDGIAMPRLTLTYNTSRASDVDGGAVWSGRGLTASVRGGVARRFGVLSVALRPVAFWSQNSAFDPALGARADTLNFRAPGWGSEIDLPYRFGDKSYARIDPGESWVQIDTRWFLGGISTATQTWGPMHVYPLLLGPNAGGFPHVVFGSGLPWNVGIGSLMVRGAVGRLDASAFAPPHTGDERRLASELVATFSPRFLPGLEVGGGRFFHRRWPTEGVGIDVLKIPFEAVLKDKLRAKDDTNAVQDNQLASIFARIVRPESGVEFYGEYLRDDHSFDINDLAGEPDHESAYGLGLRKVWSAANQPLTALTIEVANGRISHLQRLRPEDPMYVHTTITEGHTLRGKLLGSPAVFGGTGLHADIVRRDPAGGYRVTVGSERVAQNREGGTWDGTPVGYNLIGYSRYLVRRTVEYELGGRVQRGWNTLSASDNVSLFVSVRPFR